MSKIVIENDAADVRYEDGGNALILTVYNERDGEFLNPFVRLQSFREMEDPPGHPELEGLVGKKLRVTVEVIDGP